MMKDKHFTDAKALLPISGGGTISPGESYFITAAGEVNFPDIASAGTVWELYNCSPGGVDFVHPQELSLLKLVTNFVAREEFTLPTGMSCKAISDGSFWIVHINIGTGT